MNSKKTFDDFQKKTSTNHSALEKVAGVINDACVIFDKQVIAEMEHDRIKSQYLP